MSSAFSVRASRNWPPVSLTLSVLVFWFQQYAPWPARSTCRLVAAAAAAPAARAAANHNRTQERLLVVCTAMRRTAAIADGGRRGQRLQPAGSLRPHEAAVGRALVVELQDHLGIRVGVGQPDAEHPGWRACGDSSSTWMHWLGSASCSQCRARLHSRSGCKLWGWAQLGCSPVKVTFVRWPVGTTDQNVDRRFWHVLRKHKPVRLKQRDSAGQHLRCGFQERSGILPGPTYYEKHHP
jgi:hypothetical protein